MTIQHKILILVNFSFFSSGIKSILEKVEFQLIGEVSHWEGLFEFLRRITPDIILLDLLDYNDSSVNSLQKLRNEYPEIPVLLFINEESADLLRDFIVMGIMGFVFSDVTLQELIKAIDRVASGREYFPDGISKLLKETMLSDRGVHKMLRHSDRLTLRELDVCKFICNGYTHKEIGVELHISPRTVETHKKNILAKLKIKSTAELIKYMIHNHLN